MLQQRSLGWLMLASLLGAVGIPTVGLRAAPRESPPQMVEDAQLTDVHFLDAERGWAVGDRGAIWHTESGGRNWQRVRSPVNCRLSSVHFVDERRGWIAGGWFHPLTHKSTGVLLRTTDGGQTWLPSPGLTLPAILRVKFFDGQQGWAIACPSAMYPSGLFRSTDGGRSWTPLPGGRRLQISAGDFTDMNQGAIATRKGGLEFVVKQKVQASPTASQGNRPLSAMELQPDGAGWLVGAAGLVLQTRDAGLQWRVPSQALPAEVEREFDFLAVAARGDHCWIAGAPGSCVMHSADGGRSWEVLRTGQTTPLRAITFIDPRHGWAVGDLGTILATSDGGRSWRVQRRGGQRVAALALYAQAEQVPWEVLVHTSGNEGYLSAVEVLGRSDWETQPVQEGPLELRLHDAAVSASASVGEVAWNFPLRQPGLPLSAEQILRGWTRANDAPGDEQLERHLVRKIRQWRPDVVFTEEVDPRGGDRAAYLVNQLVVSAIEKAADSTRFPDQLTVAGLEAWRVKKVFSVSAGEDRTTVQVQTSQLAAQLGTSLEEYGSRSRGLIGRVPDPAPPAFVGRLLVSQSGSDSAGHSFFSGIHLARGEEARRRAGAPPVGTLDELTRLTQKRRNIQRLLQFAERSTSGEQGELSAAPGAVGSSAWLGQVDELTHGLNAKSAGDILFELAHRFEQQGEFSLAADALQNFIQRHPDHELSEAALAWLVRYYSSGEQAWRVRKRTRFAVQKLSPGVALDRSAEPSPFPVVPASGEAVRRRGDRKQQSSEAPAILIQKQETTAGAQTLDADRARQLSELGTLIQRTRPTLYAEPSIRLPLAAAARGLGRPREAEKFYHALAGQSGDPAWRQTAQCELWMAHGSGKAPKPVVNCYTHDSKPRLDGQLNDPIWATAERLTLTSDLHDDNEWPAIAMVARDDEFFYLAVHCAKAGSSKPAYPDSRAARPRDGDLSAFDRVSFLLDIDRDYQSYYRLTVDSRGWTTESCLGDAGWNPQWFVAAAQTESEWTAEAAIPLDELAAGELSAGTVWALGVQRVVPTIGFQSWTRPATVAGRGEGFGLLIFETN